MADVQRKSRLKHQNLKDEAQRRQQETLKYQDAAIQLRKELVIAQQCAKSAEKESTLNCPPAGLPSNAPSKPEQDSGGTNEVSHHLM
jgi:hypothetical protein